MLQYQDIHIPLGKLDQKTDERVLGPTGLIRAENIIFDELGGFQKRLGHTSLSLNKASGGTIEAARMRALGTRRDELVLFAEGKAWSWVDSISKWSDRGRFESVYPVSETSVAYDQTDQVLADRAEVTTAGFTSVVYAWEDRKNAGVRYAVYDKATGAIQKPTTTVFVVAATRPRCLALNNKLLVFYQSGSDLSCDVIDPLDVYGTIGSPVIVASNELSGGPYDVTPYTSTICLVAYVISTNTATVLKVDSAAAVTETFATARTCDVAIAIDYRAVTDRIGLVRLDSTGANDLIKFDWIKAATLGDDTNVDIAVVTEGNNTVNNVAVSVLTGQSAYVFWDLDVNTPDPPGTPELDTVFRATMATGGGAGAPTEMVLARRSRLGSRALRYTDGTAERVMIHVFHTSALQSQYVLLDAGYKVGDRNGEEVAGDEVGLMARWLPGTGPSSPDTRNATSDSGGLYRNGHLPQIESLGSDKYACALTYRKLSDSSRTPWKKAYQYQQRGIKDIIFTLFDSRAFTGAAEGNALYLPGGYLAHYDGQRVVESGFLLYPEDVQLAQSAVGGTRLTLTGVYNYRVYWEWRNAQGEIQRSSQAANVAITLTGTNDTVTLTIPTNPYTNKSGESVTATSGMYAAVYRTKAGATDLYYRAFSFDPGSTSSNPAKLNDTNANTITFVDIISDANLALNETDYLSNGELDNIAPPATPFVVAGQARLFTRDPADTTLIRYSKLRLESDAVEGNDALTIRGPQEGGDVNGIVVTEGALIIFSTYAAYIAVGQGLTNTGGPPDYSSPQRVADIGCIDPRSVVKSPAGIFFFSKKGIYRMSAQGGAVDYVGAAIEDSMQVAGSGGNATTWRSIVGAIHVTDKHQLRFYSNSNGIMVYDYLAEAWSRWTPAGTYKHALMWGDVPVYLDGTAPRRQFASGDGNKWLDAGTIYSIDVETGPIKLAGMGGRQKVRRVIVTGKIQGTHTLRIRTYRDDNIEHDNQTFALGAGGGVVRKRVGCKEISRLGTMRVRITDEGTAGTTLASSFDVSGIDLNVGTAPGLRFLAAADLK